MREAIADAFLRDPVGTLERLNKFLPGAEPAAGAGSTNIGQLYLTAIQSAQPQPLRVLDVEPEPGTSRVQPEPSSGNDW